MANKNCAHEAITAKGYYDRYSTHISSCCLLGIITIITGRECLEAFLWKKVNAYVDVLFNYTSR